MFLQNVRDRGQQFISALQGMRGRHAFIQDVRGVGLMVGIEVGWTPDSLDPTLANDLAKRSAEFGLILRTSRYDRGNVVKIRPALVISEAEVDEACRRLDHLFESFSRE